MLHERLDNLNMDTIPELREVIKEKVKIIEEIDGLYEVLAAKIDN